MKRKELYFLSQPSSDAHSSHDILRHFVLDLPFACGAPVGEPSSASPNRRASEAREKTPKIDTQGPPVMGLAVSHLARLAFRIGHRQARNRPGMASCRLSPLLDLEGTAWPTRTTSHFPRGPRSDPQDVPRES